jgi:hypothetical protein
LIEPSPVQSLCGAGAFKLLMDDATDEIHGAHFADQSQQDAPSFANLQET